MLEIKTVKGELITRLEAGNLDGADFSGATMREVAFERAKLRRCVFTNANLELANLRGADLTGAMMAHANLRQANLSEANLTNADLTHAVLTPADLRRANLCGANLTNADLHGTHLEGAQYDSRTRWPEGLDAHQRGAVRAQVDTGESPENRAIDLLRHNQPDEAIHVLHAALERAPQSYRLHHLLGCAYGQKSDVDYSMKHFRLALRLNRDSVSTNFDIAQLYCRVGLYWCALEHLEKVIQGAPNHERAQRLLPEVRGKLVR